MTYKEIQALYKKKFKTTIKSCWIADVKRELGLTIRIAHNRKNNDIVKYPCPEGKAKKWIEKILAHNIDDN